MIHNQVLKPVWTCFGMSQYKEVVVESSFGKNSNLHRNLDVKRVADMVKEVVKKNSGILRNHVNIEVKFLNMV